jgi:teichuronic acid biosynthesis glycosyltransferase TuaC
MLRVLAVTNMYPTEDRPWLGTFVEQQVGSLRQAGMLVDVLYIDRMSHGMGAYRKIPVELSRRLDAGGHDLVHVMYGGVMADIVTRSVKDRPTVVSFCGSDLMGEFQSGNIRRLLGAYGAFASRKAARNANGVLIKSEALRSALPSGLDPEKIRVIPNGVSLTKFRPHNRTKCRVALQWRTDSFHILFPANAGNPVKRPELARSAVSHLEKAGIRAELHFLKGVPHDQVPIWINACDAVLITSAHEGSANIIKEALACNVPVVSVDVGDARERLEHVEGCYIAEDVPYALADKLKLVRSGLTRVNGRPAVGELSLECVAERLKTFYCEILQRSSSREVADITHAAAG